MNYIVNLQATHPDDDQRPLINYDAVIMLEPMLLVGTILGVFANKAFPSWALVILLVLTVGYGTKRTWSKAMKQYRKEKEEEQVAASHDVAAYGGQLREIKVNVKFDAVESSSRQHLFRRLALSPSDIMLVAKAETDSPARRRVVQASQARIEHTRQLKTIMDEKTKRDVLIDNHEGNPVVPLIHKRVEHTRKVSMAFITNKLQT